MCQTPKIIYLLSFSMKSQTYFFQGIVYESLQPEVLKPSEKCGGNAFKAGGLNISILEPLRRWRILFNGVLR